MIHVKQFLDRNLHPYMLVLKRTVWKLAEHSTLMKSQKQMVLHSEITAMSESPCSLVPNRVEVEMSSKLTTSIQ